MLAHAIARYQSAIAAATAKHLNLPADNLDMGEPIRFGDYGPADEAYAGLVAKLAAHAPDAVPADVRRDLARSYATRTPAGEKDEKTARSTPPSRVSSRVGAARYC